MKSKPLTKEKVKVIPKETIEKIIESENLITIVFKSKDELPKYFKDSWIKKRVDWLLKEIEKEIKKHKRKAKKLDEEYDWEARNTHYGIAEGLRIAKKIIKKAFSGVIEE